MKKKVGRDMYNRAVEKTMRYIETVLLEVVPNAEAKSKSASSIVVKADSLTVFVLLALSDPLRKDQFYFEQGTKRLDVQFKYMSDAYFRNLFVGYFSIWSTAHRTPLEQFVFQKTDRAYWTLKHYERVKTTLGFYGDFTLEGATITFELEELLFVVTQSSVNIKRKNSRSDYVSVDPFDTEPRFLQALCQAILDAMARP